MNNQSGGANEDFFLDLKLPTHLPNETPVLEQHPPSLPAKPPPMTWMMGGRAIKPVSSVLKKDDKISTPAVVDSISNEDEEDEEKMLTKKNSPIAIPGTSIVLQTDEDIAQWIAERKKNWPSKKRIEQKSLELQTRKRGSEDSEQASKRQKRYCKFFIKGNCRNEHCPNLHEIPVKPLPSNKLVYHHDMPINIPERYSKSANYGKSLHKLVVEQDHYQNENTQILKIIEKLFDNKVIIPDYEKYKALQNKG